MTSKWKSIRNSTFCKSQFNYSRIKRLVLDLTLISMDHFQAFVFYSNVEESLNEISTFVNQSRSWCSQWSQLTVYLVCVNASHFQPLFVTRSATHMKLWIREWRALLRSDSSIARVCFNPTLSDWQKILSFDNMQPWVSLRTPRWETYALFQTEYINVLLV